MDTQFQALPPLKRLGLRQQERYHKLEASESAVKPWQLPAKKRKESRFDLDADENAIAAYCLPAKKRVWAIDPGLLAGKPLSPFDLNVKYQPSFQEAKVLSKTVANYPDERCSHGIMGSDPEVEDKENSDPLNNLLSKKLTEDEEVGKKVVIDPYERYSAEVDDKENIGPLKNLPNKKLDEEELPESREGKEQEREVSDEDDGIVCSVCQSTDGDPSDPIVFCDGCDLMVHATCYGDPLIKGIPEGDWFCNRCLASQSSQSQNKEDAVSCCLCPLKSGAMKPTRDGRWAHIVCALFIPEVFFEDPEGREGINCAEIPNKRFSAKCYICKSRSGCAIECSELKCLLHFHVTCGMKEDLYIEYREGKKKGAIVAGFCKDHTKLWEKQQQTGRFKIVARDEQK